MADDQELQDPSQDPAFRAASTKRKIAYLSSIDPDFAKANPQRQAKYINHLLGNDVETDFEKRNGMPDNERQANEFLLGTASSASGLPETLNPVTDMLKAQPQSPSDAIVEGLKKSLGPLPGMVGGAYGAAKEALTPQQPGETPEDVSERRSHAAGSVVGQAVPFIVGQGVDDVHNNFAERPEVAAQRALRPEPKQAQAFQKSLPNAQAYLKGASSLEDLQQRIPGAKDEIWSQYSNALGNIADHPVQGPDGPTTYGDLEKQRLGTSAQLRNFKRMLPGNQQEVLQKNQGIKELNDRYNAILAPLDEGMNSQGVDAAAIRSTFGDVQQMNRLTQGKNTLAEPDRRYGLGRMAKKASLWHPIDSLSGIGEGVQDILAGRPLWSGKPTDVNIKEGFRSGGPKPDFSVPQTMPSTSPDFSDLPTSDSPSSFRTGSPVSAQESQGPVAPPKGGESGTTPSYSASPKQSPTGPIDMTPSPMPSVRPEPQTQVTQSPDGTMIKTPPPNHAREIFGMENQLVQQGLPQEHIGTVRRTAMDLKDNLGDSRPWDDFYHEFLRRNTAIDASPSSPTFPPSPMPTVLSEGTVTTPPLTSDSPADTGLPGAKNAPSPFQASQLIRPRLVPPQQ